MIGSVLFVIDQQKGIDHPKLGVRNNPDAERVMLSLLALWRAKKWPIFHIKHRSLEVGSVFWPKQQGFDHKPDFVPQAGECLIEKTVPCAFANNITQSRLQTLAVTSITIVGGATNNSIESTARTAGNLGYQVTVVDDACFTFAKADYEGQLRSAPQVHAMSLANLNGEYATVRHSHEYLAYLKHM